MHAVKPTFIRLGAGALSVGPFTFSKASSSNYFLSAGSGGAASSWGKAFKLCGTGSHLGFLTNPETTDAGVSKLFRHIFLKKENTTQKRQNIWTISAIWQKLEIWEIFTKQWRRRTMESLIIKFHCFYPLHLAMLIKQKYLSLVTR